MLNKKEKKIDMVRKQTTTGKIISELMLELGIKEAELARQTGLPQTTINRLLIGDTFDPRSNTLKPIAKFFGVTIGQIMGEEQINSQRITGTFEPNNKEAWSHVPIIDWEDAISWIFRQDSFSIHSHKKWITTERPIGKIAFAIIAKQFMEPRFRKNSILIVDPNADYNDGKFIVVTFDNKNITVRQISYDYSDMYLKHFDTTIPTIKFNKENHKILGVIVEARIEL